MSKQDIVKSLIKEVNKSDKEMGVRLKSHNIMNEPEQQLAIAELSCDYMIRSCICGISNIDPVEYLGYKEPNAIEFVYKQHTVPFTEVSYLPWNDDTFEFFRARNSENGLRMWCIKIYDTFVGNIDKIVINRANISGIHEHEIPQIGIKYAKDLQRLALRFKEKCAYNKTRGEAWHKDVLDINSTSMCLCKKIDHAYIDKIIRVQSKSISEALLRDKLFNHSNISDDMIISDLMHLAYTLCTYDDPNNIKYFPKWKYIKGATRNNDVSKLIEAMGASINYHTKHPKNTLFRAYLEIPFDIHTHYLNINKDLDMGIRALDFTALLIGDPKVYRFVDQLFKDGD